MPPPKLPAHLDGSRRAEPAASAAVPREPEELDSQLGALLSATQRLEQSWQSSNTSLQELRGEVKTLNGDVQTLRSHIRDIPIPGPAVPQPLFPSTPPEVKSGRAPLYAAVLAAVLSAGALAMGALLWQQQRHQQASLAQVAAMSQALDKAVEKLGEQVASLPPPAPTAPPAPSGDSAGKHGPGEGASSKPRVVLPNLVGLRLADARTTVAPLQLQLLPVDKKLKESSKIGWQSPSPGAELESEEAVTVSLKPPTQNQKKKKKHG